MKFKWIISLLSTVWLAIIFIWTAAAETWNISLSEQLLNSKDALVIQSDTITQTLESEYNRLIWPKVDTANYQSLICLGVVEDDNLLLQLQQKLDLLKTSFLQDYVDINAKIFNLLNQYSVGLIDETDYTTQYEELLLDVQSYYTNHKLLLDNAKQEYLDKLFSFISESEGYVNNNSELLDSLNAKITKIQSSMHQFAILEEGIFEINNALNLQQGNFFDTLQSTRNTVISTLTSELNQQIQRYDRKYTNNPELKTSYEQKRDETINRFTNNLDQKINDMIGSRYDAKEYSYVKEQIGIIKARFYDQDENNKEKLNCEKVIATNLDLNWYINDVEKAVISLRKDVSAWVVTLTNAGTGTDPKTEILASFKKVYITNYNIELEAFKNFVRSNWVVENTITDTNTEIQTTVPLVITAYTFDRPFEKWEINDGVKQLQTLLTKLWYYQGQIWGKYDYATTEAVYQFQLAKWILKGLPGETAQWYLWPATRAALNEVIKNYLTATIPTTTSTTTPEPITTANPFLSLIKQLEARYNNKEAFVILMQKALDTLTPKLNDNITVRKKLVFNNIITAIKEYLASSS